MGIRSNELGLSMAYTTQMTCALRISDSRCWRSCGVPEERRYFRIEVRYTFSIRTAGVHNVGRYILWRDFWRYGDLWHDMLDLGIDVA